MRISCAFAAVFLLAGPSFSNVSYAQVRIEPDTSSFVDPATGPMAKMLFGQSGYFMIAGGVVLAGTAGFVLERDGAAHLVPAEAIVPVAERDGSVSLLNANVSYSVGMPAGLACPLGRFVARDGVIAYTVPKFMDPDSRQVMMRAGIVHHRVAKEFDGTPFEALLHAADFAATTKLPPQTAQMLTASMNNPNGLDGFVIQASDDTDKPFGSLINTDAQVRYRVYLMQGQHRVEIGGVPLRYFWELDRSGAAGVFAVDEFAQNWPAGTKLTDYSVPHAQAGQYDIVNFYQVAGMFRALHTSNPGRFAAFVEQACSR